MRSLFLVLIVQLFISGAIGTQEFSFPSNTNGDTIQQTCESMKQTYRKECSCSV